MYFISVLGKNSRPVNFIMARTAGRDQQVQSTVDV